MQIDEAAKVEWPPSVYHVVNAQLLRFILGQRAAVSFPPAATTLAQYLHCRDS